jgi:hypothetical protein
MDYNQIASRPRRAAIILGSLVYLLKGHASEADLTQGLTLEPMSLPRSPYAGESDTLRQRLKGTLVSWYLVGEKVQPFELDLGSGLRKLRADAGHSIMSILSEPDAKGQFVYGVSVREADVLQSGLELIDRSAQRRILLRTKEPFSVFARDIALSFNGEKLAYLRTSLNSSEENLRGTRVDFHLWLLDTASTGLTRRLLEGHFVLSGLVDSVLSWFPDNRHLIAVVQGPRGRAAGSPRLSREEPDAQMALVDTEVGTYRMIGQGRQVWVSTDGTSLLVRLHEITPDLDAAAIQRLRASANRPVLLFRRTVTTIDNIAEPQPLNHIPPEITAVLAWVNDRYLIYRGDVTSGAPSGLTTGNSPLVGPKRLQAVKVMDTYTGEYLTILEGVDPRRKIKVR